MFRCILSAFCTVACRHGMPRFLWGFAALIPCILSAAELTVPPMSAEGFFDIEVSTNIVFNGSRYTVKELSFQFMFDGAASNNVQIAFGGDGDGDGMLSASETEAVYGWRRGRYFAEGYVSGERFEEPAAAVSVSQTFSVKMRISRNVRARDFNALSDGAGVLEEMSRTVPDWLYRPEWNLMCITRRGADVPSEWFSCDVKYGSFWIVVR